LNFLHHFLNISQKIIGLCSKRTFFAPEWNYFIFESFLENIDFENLTNFILSKKEYILKLPLSKTSGNTDGYTNLGKDSTTARYSKYNVLAWNNDQIKKIKKQIIDFHNEILNIMKQPLVKNLYAQCWVNIMSKGQQVSPHMHLATPDTYLGGHISIQCENTSTYYINPVNQLNEPEVYQSKNKNGKITLFQNCIPHYTDIHNSDTPRITIAFDIYKDKQYEHYIKLR
jgi:hypothetical protein